MNLSKSIEAPRRPVLPAIGFGVLIAALLGLTLAFEGPRVAVNDGIERLTAGSSSGRTVVVETEPMTTGDLSLRFRIGLQDKQVAKKLEQVMPRFYGNMLHDFMTDPVRADPETGKLDLIAIELRARDQLDSLLGAGQVGTVRISEIRRRPI